MLEHLTNSRGVDRIGKSRDGYQIQKNIRALKDDNKYLGVLSKIRSDSTDYPADFMLYQIKFSEVQSEVQSRT